MVYVEKWNWPPSKYIYPFFTGFHYADHQLDNQPGTPFKYEFLTGLGGEYLKSYEPIGCRDYYTMNNLQKLGIESSFTGCITLTIPKMPKIENKNEYICVVDLDNRVVNKLKEIFKDTNFEIKIMTHNRERNPNITWNERMKIVTDILTTYQNAHCVITNRLHSCLPCLAMEVPVFLIKEKEDDTRFTPYNDWLYRSTITNFLNKNYEYDFINPPQNKDNYKVYQRKIITNVKTFIENTKNCNKTADELNRTTYTSYDLLKWRHDLMKVSMDEWYLKYRKAQRQITSLDKNNKKIQKQYNQSINQNEKLNKEIKELKIQNKKLEQLNEHQTKTLNYRSVRYALKIRNIILKIKKIFKGKKIS